MMFAPRICVIIPVYNHPLTILRVVRGAKPIFPVIVVNDGCTDETPALLAGEPDITIITLQRNEGKGAALMAGFGRAKEMDFTHAITIDADGQHRTEALTEFALACQRHPEAFIIGTRDLKKAGAPLARRLSNHLSTFWFKFETGVRLEDTQCGYRGYALAPMQHLHVRSGRYAFELEIMVKAAWAGIPLLALPVEADYAAPTSRLSHFDPLTDFGRIFCLHSRLAMQAFCMPAPLRKLSARGDLRCLAPQRRWRAVLSHLFSEHTETPGRTAAAVGLGLFCGIAPIWGFQMMAAALLAHKLRLNKVIAVTASHVSFPLAAPFILAAGLVLGHFLHTGNRIQFNPAGVAEQIPALFVEWFLGSIALALSVGLLGTFASYLLARMAAGFKSKGQHE